MRVPASPGDTIAGRYRIEAWLGQGAMASVFRATHLGTGQPCALKLVHPQLAAHANICEMFVQEARLGARIGRNPYIVDVFDAGVDPERGLPFLAMELLEGETLDKYIRQRGPMPSPLLRVLMLQLADALGQAHAANVIHRDLKPGNLFLTYDRKGAPQLKIVDFGIAKVLEEGVDQTATQVGSPAYASPEQLGQAMRPVAEKMGVTIGHGVSPATDIWALGVIAYELMLGAPPGHLWTGKDRSTVADMMMGVAINPTPSMSERAGAKVHLVPRGFDVWLDRCLRKNAVERFPRIEDAARELATLLENGFDDDDMTHVRRPQRPARAGGMVQLPPMPPAPLPPPPPTERIPEGYSPNPLPLPTLPPVQTALPPAPFAPSPPAFEPPRPVFPGNASPAATQFGGTSYTKPSRGPSVAAVVLMGFALVLGLGVAVFALIPKNGQLSIEVASPDGQKLPPYEIFVDGRKVCDAVPCHIDEVPSGKRTVKLMSSDGSYSPVKEAEVARGGKTTISFEWPRQTAQAAETAPSSPSTDRIPIPQEKPDDQAPPVPSPETKNDSAPSSAPKDAQGTASLNLNSIPVSKVVLDGRPLGNTPKVKISVPAGSHTVQFIHPELGRKSVTVTVKAGETKTAAVKF